jgi:hypothetical protein
LPLYLLLLLLLLLFKPLPLLLLLLLIPLLLPLPHVLQLVLQLLAPRFQYHRRLHPRQQPPLRLLRAPLAVPPRRRRVALGRRAAVAPVRLAASQALLQLGQGAGRLGSAALQCLCQLPAKTQGLMRSVGLQGSQLPPLPAPQDSTHWLQTQVYASLDPAGKRGCRRKGGIWGEQPAPPYLTRAMVRDSSCSADAAI